MNFSPETTKVKGRRLLRNPSSTTASPAKNQSRKLSEAKIVADSMTANLLPSSPQPFKVDGKKYTDLDEEPEENAGFCQNCSCTIS